MSETRTVDPQTRGEIEQLITEMLWRLDHGQADRLWELYTEDGVSDGPMGVMEGRESLRAWGEKRAAAPAPNGRHHLGGIRLAWQGEDLIGYVQYVTYRESSAEPLLPASVGEFHEVYRRVDGEWRFASRTIRPLFGGANAAAHARAVNGQAAS